MTRRVRVAGPAGVLAPSCFNLASCREPLRTPSPHFAASTSLVRVTPRICARLGRTSLPSHGRPVDQWGNALFCRSSEGGSPLSSMRAWKLWFLLLACCYRSPGIKKLPKQDWVARIAAFDLLTTGKSSRLRMTLILRHPRPADRSSMLQPTSAPASAGFQPANPGTVETQKLRDRTATQPAVWACVRGTRKRRRPGLPECS